MRILPEVPSRDALQQRYGERYKWLVLLVVGIGTVAAVLATTSFSVAVPALGRHFELGQDRVQWAITGFMGALTVAMLGISAFVRSYGWAMLGAAIFIAMGGRWALTAESIRQKFDAAWLNLPLVGRLARGYNAARFAGTLAMLAGAGVPILKALQAAAETLNNRALRADALDALVLVREGAPLASALASKKRFPPLVAMFARLGEQTGQLPVMLQRAAVQLGAEVQRRAMHLATILEPLLIVAMGVVVMLIVLAVLMPIIQLNQLVK